MASEGQVVPVDVRDRLHAVIDAALDDLPQPDSRCERDRWRIVSRITLDAVEPPIRADERAKAIPPGRPGCAGKTFEHHDSLTWDDAVLVRWRCADCGTTGGYAEINERMMPVVPWIDRVRAAMNLYPVILLPSDAKPGFFGDFMGCKVYRVQGIDKPMVALAGA